MNSKCWHCGGQAKLSIGVSSKQGNFCQACYNKWFELRDEAVSKLFGEYIKDGSSPKKSSTR